MAIDSLGDAELRSKHHADGRAAYLHENVPFFWATVPCHVVPISTGVQRTDDLKGVGPRPYRRSYDRFVAKCLDLVIIEL